MGHISTPYAVCTNEQTDKVFFVAYNRSDPIKAKQSPVQEVLKEEGGGVVGEGGGVSTCTVLKRKRSSKPKKKLKHPNLFS